MVTQPSSNVMHFVYISRFTYVAPSVLESMQSSDFRPRYDPYDEIPDMATFTQSAKVSESTFF